MQTGQDSTSTVRAFISYAWTDGDHQKWVVDLATQLRTDGIDVVLDVWDLEPGQDKYRFMEQMVNEPTIGHVLMICNEKYAEKANTREGGVGDETQIISPEIYSNTKNKKFIPIVAELDDDGRSFVPSFLKARIYIDLSSEQAYFEGYEKLLRLLHGAPEFAKPPLGGKPGFLAGGQAPGSTTMPLLRRAVAALEQDKRIAVALAEDHLGAVAAAIKGLRVAGDSQPIDERVVDSIKRGKGLRDETLELLETLCRATPDDTAARVLHQLFENILDGCYHQGGNHWQEAEYDAVRYVTMELFLHVVALLLAVDKPGLLKIFLDETYVHREHYGKHTTSAYDAFSFEIESIERVRNHRLNLRRTSPVADLIKERADREKTPFEQIQQVDFLLFLRSRLSEGSRWWYPRTLVYLGHHHSAFPVFLGLESPRRVARLDAVLGVGVSKNLRAKFESSFQEPSSRSLRFGQGHWPVSIPSLMSLGRDKS